MVGYRLDGRCVELRLRSYVSVAFVQLRECWFCASTLVLHLRCDVLCGVALSSI